MMHSPSRSRRRRAIATRVRVMTLAITAITATGALAENPLDGLPPSRGMLLSLEGRLAETQMLAVDGTGSRWLDAHDNAVSLGPEGLLSWGRCPPPPVGSFVELMDGSVLAGRMVASDGVRLLIDNDLFGRLDLPLRVVAAWRAAAIDVNEPSSPIAPVEVRLINGDLIRATSIEMKRVGGSRRLSIHVVAANADTPPVDVPLQRIETIRWAGNGRPVGDENGSATGRGMWLAGFRDGSRLSIDAVRATADPSRVDIVLRLGADEKRAVGCTRRSIVGLITVAGPVHWLAELDPAETSQRPSFGPAWPLARGRTLAARTPQARGEHAFSCLGIHSAATLRYRLPTSAERFVARVAIDDSAGSGGSVVIHVRAGTEENHLDHVFESPRLRGGDAPLDVSLPLDDATWLELEVDPTNDGDVLDRTVWLDPFVVTRRTSRAAAREPSPGSSGASPRTSPTRPAGTPSR